MLQLNKGMMQFFKHPFHRNDLVNTTALTLNIYSGASQLTTTELAFAAGATVSLASGLFNQTAMETHLKTTRTQVGFLTLNSGTTRVAINPIDIKRTGTLADESALSFSRRSETVYAIANGQAAMAEIVVYGTALASNVRNLYYASIGLEGSGADLIISDQDFVIGSRYRISDFRFQLANLLGEL